MTSRMFADLRAPQIAEVITDKSILIQPIGAVEQHGPHLPFNTDYVIADAVGQALADNYGDELDLWLLPTLAYSKSNEHAWSAGSVWLGPETVLAVLDDLGRSLAKLPAHKLVFVNGHGGNSSLLNVACRELRLHHGLETFLMHPHIPADQGGPSSERELGMGVHGGLEETSIMLHLRPELVDMTAAKRNVPTWLAGNTHVCFGGSVSFGWLSNDFGDDGHIGDPTSATGDLGKLAFDGAVANLGAALREVSEFQLPRR